MKTNNILDTKNWISEHYGGMTFGECDNVFLERNNEFIQDGMKNCYSTFRILSNGNLEEFLKQMISINKMGLN